MGKLYLGTQAITPFVYDGATPGEPLDPMRVYQETRPSDWLEMPTPANNEIYLLVKVGKPLQEKSPGAPLAFTCNTSTGQYKVELGTVENGQFVANNDYTTLLNSGISYTTYIHYADWAAHPMADGMHQVMVKISTVSGDLRKFDHVKSVTGAIYSNRNTLEFRGHCESMNSCIVGTTGTAIITQAASIRYFSLEGTNNLSDFLNMFAGCDSLVAILQLNTSHGTNFGGMFHSCYSLLAIPQLNTSSGTTFFNMFYNCFSLEGIPQLNTSSGTSFSYMFNNCYSLLAIPQLNTSSGTNFANMFYNCRSLLAIPQLNTSSGTNFANMFSNCYSLEGIPQLDTSSGTDFSGIFSSCISLTELPSLDTSSGTAFGNMFTNCYSLLYINFAGCDFTSITTAANRPNGYTNGGGIMRIGNKFKMSTGGFTSAVMGWPQGIGASNPFYVLVEDETEMIPLGANATTVFTASQYVYVVVPDNMYDTYAADTYWATLGARLKKRSEVTLPDWYTN